MAASAEPKRLLIADDHPDLAQLLAELLVVTAPFPIEVSVAFDGASALSMALADLPDCLILDIDMPVMDGITAALAIRAELGAHAPVLIALTADPGHLASSRAATAFDHFFIKPANIDELLVVIDSLQPP